MEQLDTLETQLGQKIEKIEEEGSGSKKNSNLNLTQQPTPK